MIKKIITIFLCVFLLGCSPQERDAAQDTAKDGHIEKTASIGNSLKTTSENLDTNVRKLSTHLNTTKHSQSLKVAEKKPIPPKRNTEKPKKVDVRGIYLNRTSIREENIQRYIDLIKSTNLNAAVIDIKDDYGKLTYNSNIELANQIGSDSNPATQDLKKTVKRFKDAGIYTIARIVVFKDPYLAAQKGEYAMKRKDGTIWQDAAGTKWVDPYKEEVWSYITSIAQEASNSGFDEIQYDYIRFPENGKKVDQEVSFDNPNEYSKADNILAFLNYSKEKLKYEPVYVSADIFGLVTTAKTDMGIGQIWENISPNVDYISPMTYPSHYAPGSYGIPNPDRAPYEIMLQAMKDAKERNQQLKTNGEQIAVIRPWIQDFDYKSVYTAADVQKQIKALQEQGITQYLIWNAGNVYTVEAFK
jgi:hypothetical protein